jgi:thiamine biosynthesis protein ThiS
MIIKINGKVEEVGASRTIAALLKDKGLSCGRVVVEHNSRIIPRDELGAVSLNENDSLEIVSFVGGG